MPTLGLLSRISRFPLLAGVLVVGVGCAGRTPAPITAATVAPSPVVAQAALPPAPSVFDLKDSWASQHVDAAKLSSLSGGLLVVGFINPACDAPCLATLTSLRAVERETDAGVHFVLVSTAAQNDSPSKLAAFAKARHLPANRYTVISGSPEAVAGLTAALDVQGRGITAAQLEASSTLSVLDFNGIVVQQRGSGTVAPIIEALTLLSNIR